MQSKARHCNQRLLLPTLIADMPLLLLLQQLIRTANQFPLMKSTTRQRRGTASVQCLRHFFLVLLVTSAILAMQSRTVESQQPQCTRDADCESIAPFRRVVCRLGQCNCREQFMEQHTFDNETQLKTQVICIWPTPVWAWVLTHFVAILSPFILAGLLYLLIASCRDCCRSVEQASLDETRPIKRPSG